MKFTRSDTARLPYLLVLLIATQVFCAAFFLWDVLSDIPEVGHGGDPAWHLAIEGLAVLTLCAAIFLEIRYILWLLRRKESLERSVSVARAAIQDVVEAHFEEWALTPAERDVAMLLVKGMSNSEIAEIRGSAEGTVKSQLNAIYRKSGTTGRGELLSHIIDSMMA